MKVIDAEWSEEEGIVRFQGTLFNCDGSRKTEKVLRNEILEAWNHSALREDVKWSGRLLGTKLYLDEIEELEEKDGIIEVDLL